MVDAPGALALIPAWEDVEALIRPLATHPLVEYTLAACAQAAPVARTVILSQDERVGQLARAWGAEVLPLLAPPSGPLAGAPQPTAGLIRAAAAAGANPPSLVLWLDPFFPLRRRGDLERALSQAAGLPAGSLVRSMAPLNPGGGDLWASPDGETWTPLRDHRHLVAQTGHVMAARLETFLSAGQAQPVREVPFIVDPDLSADLRQESGRAWVEWLLQRGRQDLVYPGRLPRPLPDHTELLILDFDGVLTDNRVWVDEEGREQVAAYRSDSLGLSYLRRAGIEAMVISMETNPVVTARCRKMKLPVLQGIDDKAAALGRLLQERQIDPAHVVYLGNDMNDVPCFPLVGCAVAVADAQPGALREADLVLSRPGGHGAVRELCDRLIEMRKG